MLTNKEKQNEELAQRAWQKKKEWQETIKEEERIRAEARAEAEIDIAEREKQKKKKKEIIGFQGFVVLVFILFFVAMVSIDREAPETTTPAQISQSQQGISKTIKFVDNPNGLRLRYEPLLSAEVLEILKDKTKVEVLTKKNGWTRVKAGSSLGWVASEYLATQEAQAGDKVENKEIQIKSDIENIVKETNNTAAVEITKKGNMYEVFVAFVASDNAFGNKYIKLGIQEDTTELYKALFNSGLPISIIQIGAVFPIIDKYGYEKNDTVYATELTNVEAKKVNWDEDTGFLAIQTMPGVWTLLKSIF